MLAKQAVFTHVAAGLGSATGLRMQAHWGDGRHASWRVIIAGRGGSPGALQALPRPLWQSLPDLTRAALARAAVDAAAAGQAPLAGLGLGSDDGAPQGPLRAAAAGQAPEAEASAPQGTLQAAAAAVLAKHRPAAEAARRWPIRFRQLKQAGQAVAMRLVREADLEGLVAAGEAGMGKNNPHLLGYTARPLEQHLADALARHAKQAAGTPV